MYTSLKYFKEYNNNPYGENIDDCVIRAISLFTHRDYYEVFDALCEYAGGVIGNRIKEMYFYLGLSRKVTRLENLRKK